MGSLNDIAVASLTHLKIINFHHQNIKICYDVIPSHENFCELKRMIDKKITQDAIYKIIYKIYKIICLSRLTKCLGTFVLTGNKW